MNIFCFNFAFQEFASDVPKCDFLCLFPSWCSLEFFWICMLTIFHEIWVKCWLSFLKIFFLPHFLLYGIAIVCLLGHFYIVFRSLSLWFFKKSFSSLSSVWIILMDLSSRSLYPLHFFFLSYPIFCGNRLIIVFHLDTVLFSSRFCIWFFFMVSLLRLPSCSLTVPAFLLATLSVPTVTAYVL